LPFSTVIQSSDARCANSLALKARWKRWYCMQTRLTIGSPRRFAAPERRASY
jgi:hypothetical protein